MILRLILRRQFFNIVTVISVFYILVIVENTCKYIKIKGLSSIRLFYEIPFVYKLVMTLIVGFTGYVLLSLDLQFTVNSAIVCFCVFVLLGMSLCAFSFSEKVLLKTLGIKIYQVLLIRLLLLSIPFFFLDIYIGLIVATAGNLCVMLLQEVNVGKSKWRVPALYRQSSYQWLSSFRRGGLWIQTVGFLFFAMALYQGNENMASVAFGWLICVPCFMSYFGVPDSRFWLANYGSVGFLLKSKLVELFINAMLPALVCLPLAAIFLPVYLPMFMRISVAFLFVDLLFFYCTYLCYPSKIMPFICSFIIITLSLVLIVMHPALSMFLSIPLLSVLHIISVQNLKSVLYVSITP